METEPEKIEINLSNAKVTLQQWPLRPGWKMARQIIGMFPADATQEIDLNTLLGESNLELAIDMMAHGIESEDFEKAKQTVERFGLTDSVKVLEAVLRHNLGFLLDRLNQLRIESGQATTQR